MKNYVARVAVICMVVPVFIAGCATPGSVPVGKYDFQYQISGDAATRPYQVFDDGQYTYFQFREVPEKLVVNAVTPSGLVPIDTRTSINYVRTESVLNDWQLNYNHRIYTIGYTGEARDNQIKGIPIVGPNDEQSSSFVTVPDTPEDIVQESVTENSNVPTSSDALAEPLPLWMLTAGKSIGHELKAWGDKAGWKVIWNLPTDWTIPANTTYEGEFSTAAAKVIETLASNGALVRSQFYEGNKTMVINGPGVPAQ